jgi:hypothetical protein
MPYTMDDFLREVATESLEKMTTEQRMQGLTVDEILRDVPIKTIEAHLRRRRRHAKTSGAKKRKPKG